MFFLASAFIDRRDGWSTRKELLETQRMIGGALSPVLVAEKWGFSGRNLQVTSFFCHGTSMGGDTSKGGNAGICATTATQHVQSCRRYLLRQNTKIPHREYQLQQWHPAWFTLRKTRGAAGAEEALGKERELSTDERTRRLSWSTLRVSRLDTHTAGKAQAASSGWVYRVRTVCSQVSLLFAIAPSTTSRPTNKTTKTK